MGLRDMLFIGPCSDKFVACAHVKHQILTWDSFTNPYEQMHETTDLSTPTYTTKNVISQRRRNLLQANSNVPAETIQYIDMDSTTFQKHSIATNAELLETFRFNIRLMVAQNQLRGVYYRMIRIRIQMKMVLTLLLNSCNITKYNYLSVDSILLQHR